VSSFTANRAGIGALLRSDGMVAAMEQHAERIAATARATAPVGDAAHDSHPGEYRDSIVVTSTKSGGSDGRRAAASVVATAPYSRWVEYGNGTESGPAHHTIARAAGTVGEG
jgi:hypothetical protein